MNALSPDQLSNAGLAWVLLSIAALVVGVLVGQAWKHAARCEHMYCSTSLRTCIVCGHTQGQP